MREQQHSNDPNEDDYGDEAKDIEEEEVIQAILQLGNNILQNLGVEEQITDMGVFFGDAFYLQFFQVAFPDIDFSNIQEAQTEDEMAENLQYLIDLLGQQILKYDLSHITGEEIVQGNPEHCINLLQLVLEISEMVRNQGPNSQSRGQEDGSPRDNEGDEETDRDGTEQKQKVNISDQFVDMEAEDQEDDEAQVVQQKQPRRPNNQDQPSDSKNQASAARGRSYSDDKRGKAGAFEMDMEGEDDDDEDEEEQQLLMMQQQLLKQQQLQKNGDQSKQSVKQQNFQQDDEDGLEDDGGELDEDEMKMYEQFLAQNQKDQQQLAYQGQNHFDLEGEDDDEEQEEEMRQLKQQIQNEMPGEGGEGHMEGEGEEEEDEEWDIDPENVDYEHLDPQILEMAEQMGIHPKEVLKMIIQMQKEGDVDGEDGEGMGEDDDEDEEMDEQALKQQLEQVTNMNNKNQLQQQQINQSSSSKQQKPNQQQQKLPHEMMAQQDGSEYSENEQMTRDKLADRQSYSAPYIIMDDCYEEKLCDTEQEQDEDSAHTTTVLKNLEEQEMLQQQMMMQQLPPEMQQQMQMQLQQQQQQRAANQAANLTGGSSKVNKSGAAPGPSSQKNQLNLGDEDDDEEELDIDVGQKLMQLKDQQMQQEQLAYQQQLLQQQMEDDEYGDEGEDDGEDELVDLENLPEDKRQMLLEYLQQEYDRNPDNFPYPKEVLDHYQRELALKQQSNGKQRQDTESVRDIKSDEMIVEDNSQQQFNQDEEHILGGGEEIENQNALEDEEDGQRDEDGHNEQDENQEQFEGDEELTPEQQQQFQMLLQQQMLQQQQQEQEYGQEIDNDDGEGDDGQDGEGMDELQQQMLQNYQMQQQLMLQQQQQQQQLQRSSKKPKSGKKGARPKSAGTKRKPPTYPQTNYQPQNQHLLNQEQMQQQEQLLQQQQLLAMLQQEGVDIENMDPNILQQLIIAQSQQQQQMLLNQEDQSATLQARPRTAKRKSTSNKKGRPSSGNTINTSIKRNITKLQPYQMPRSTKVLGPITPSTNYKSFNTNRSYNQTFSKKKRKKSSSKKNPQQLSLNPSLQQYPGLPAEAQFQLLNHAAPEQQMLYQQQLQQLQQQAQFQLPLLSEDYLNQLSEEELQQVLYDQQQLMQLQQHMQMQQPPKSTKKNTSLRPKSAKSSNIASTKAIKPKGITQSYSNFYQPYMQGGLKKKSTLTSGGLKATAGKGKKKKKKSVATNQTAMNALQQQMQLYQQLDHQGVLMNNYFPALEAGNQLIANSQLTEDGMSGPTVGSKDQRYPKFSHELVNNPNAMALMAAGLANQDQIEEVSQEQEDGESQEQKLQSMAQFAAQNGLDPYSQQMLLAAQQQNEDEGEDEGQQEGDDNEHNPSQMLQDQDIGQEMGDQEQQDISHGEEQDQPVEEEQVELTDDQLLQLIQNAHNLTPEQQLQLQMILQQKMKTEMAQERAQSYQNIYNILMDNVTKAKERLAPLGQPIQGLDNAEETDRRILKKKQEFEALYRQYQHEMKTREAKKRHEDSKTNKKLQRDLKTQQIKERKFQEDLLNHQKSLNYKRNAQQVRLCQKVYKLASELEKNKLLAEKREFKENLQKKKQQSKVMVDALDNFYKNMIGMLKEKIENEKFERKIAQQAQQQAIARMKRELNYQKKQEIEKQLQLLRQEDEKYDFESTNLQKMEQEIIRLYKK